SSSNSTVTIDPSSDWGMSDWNVDCTDQLYRQWFWYRVGSTGKEKPVNALSLLDVDCVGTKALSVLYGNSQFHLELSFELIGGAWGSGASDILERVTIQNISGGSLQFHLFQYSDFDLGDTGPGDTLLLSKNSFGLFDHANQIKGTTL